MKSNEIDIIQIKEIFKTNLNEEVIDLIDSSKGCDQIVKIVNTANNNKFVLKIPREDKDKIHKERNACLLCEEKNIPVPKIIYYDTNCLIQSFIPGKDLEADSRSDREEILYKKIGQYLNKMHTIKLKVKIKNKKKNIDQ